MTDAPTPLIAAIATAPDEATHARLLRDGARVLLADPAAIADVATAAVDPDSDATTQAAAALLSSALDEARMAAENDAPEGTALLDAVAAAITARDAGQPLAPVLRLRLARIYARAGLVPPPFATLTADVMAEAGAASEDMPDLNALLDPILQEIGDEPLQVHAALGELLAGLPAELAAMVVSMILARPGAVEARLGLYWLLDPQADLRLAAATVLLSRAETGGLAPDLAALLPAIRKWLPDDSTRAALDGAIRRQMRSGMARTEAPTAKIHRAAASLPDGAGAQSLIAAVQTGSRRGVAMAMLKQGHGVKDAFIIPCASATEQRQMLAGVLDEIETFDISPDALVAALARGLGEGLALGHLPAPGIVDLAERLGLAALIPAAAETDDILASIGAAEALAGLPAAHRTELVRASADWIELFDQADSWFEDTGTLRAAITRARTEKGSETAVWKHLGTRRDWWARHFAVSAATLKEEAGVEPAFWLSFAAVAQALLEGRSLKRIPIMAEIVAMTLEAHSEREGNASPVPRSEEQDGAGSLLAHAGVTEAYLHGYLAALAITPLEPAPEAWLGALLGGIAFPGQGALDQLMEFVVVQANLADDEAGDPETTARALAALDEDGLRDWAAGFDDLVAATRRSWPTKSLAADDKRVLRDIGQIAKGADGTTLRAVLPSWVARRHALRK
ncbi:UPF0149 family protein [Tropicimonas sp. IMCC6043]|uniref:UPF0149 family protein n=1 Tax=Tropicimonas sp. IMCC6043 TaxID=2510645 RepID=UPI00101BA5D5|nr:UPF0149 family protein [Tropicimonas sp. IMCC6043]RYH06355.1 hypothetical protein EU800_24110 [Tropicimonas sp. IMCC6043]